MTTTTDRPCFSIATGFARAISISFPHKQLRFLFTVSSGATPQSGNSDFWDGDIFWATPEDVSGGSKTLSSTRRRIDINGTTLDVRLLSDGERSVLALILDISKRLAQANPRLDDPLVSGEAVILIDEIDLHLHPQWQRKIVGNLERTFPNCQFIATTHSPQIIGEVPHDRIQMIKDGRIYSPRRSFGIDSSRVLEEVMNTDSRNPAIEQEIGRIAKLIANKSAEARAAIEALSEEIGADDPEITRARTLLDFMEGDA
jgi:predicted ATP-binding protein involved in virulence